MNIIKKALCLLLITLLAIGACGCMNHEEYSKKILDELNSRYNKEFEIVKLTYEVSGSSGNFYRAVCKAKDNDNTFVSYYYLNGSDYLLAENNEANDKKSDNKPLLVDEYINLCLAEMYSDYISRLDNSILFVTTEMSFNENAPTFADLEKGLDYCLSASNYKTLAKVYVFANTNISQKADFEDELINKVSNFDLYVQSFDIAFIDESNCEEIKNRYQDNTDSIRDKAKRDDDITRYVWFLTESSKGVVTQKVVKGE